MALLLESRWLVDEVQTLYVMALRARPPLSRAEKPCQRASVGAFTVGVELASVGCVVKTWDIWIERRDGSRECYRVDAELSMAAVIEALQRHRAKTGDPIDGESCWVKQMLEVVQ